MNICRKQGLQAAVYLAMALYAAQTIEMVRFNLNDKVASAGLLCAGMASMFPGLIDNVQ